MEATEIIWSAKGDSVVDHRTVTRGAYGVMAIIIGNYIGGARGVVVIVVGNGHGDTSSNPGRDSLHFT